MKILNIGKEFSLDPSGRYLTDGDGNGEAFRENFLRPIIASLNPGEKLQIILDDGVDGFGSSFLSEGFAGMVRYGYITGEEFSAILDIKYDDPDFEFYKDKIYEYIAASQYNSKTYVPTPTDD